MISHKVVQISIRVGEQMTKVPTPLIFTLQGPIKLTDSYSHRIISCLVGAYFHAVFLGSFFMTRITG